MTDEDWINEALTNDAIVIDILLKLHRADPSPSPQPPPLPVSKTAKALNLDWTVRQRRSKSVLKNDVNKKDEGEGTRASPTTPLSWSGGTSVSGGAVEGFEESSRLAKPFDGSRSKVAVTNETTNTNKRSRKKKTLAELREEENLLLKERKILKTELVTLRFTVEKHIATNESLKRMKLDMQPLQTLRTSMDYVSSEETISNQSLQTDIASPCTPANLPTGVHCSNLPAAPQALPSNNSAKEQEVESRKAHCLLPDLNLPIEEEPGSEILYGMS